MNSVCLHVMTCSPSMHTYMHTCICTHIYTSQDVNAEKGHYMMDLSAGQRGNLNTFHGHSFFATKNPKPNEKGADTGIYIYIYICMCLCMNACMSASAYECMYV